MSFNNADYKTSHALLVLCLLGTSLAHASQTQTASLAQTNGNWFTNWWYGRSVAQQPIAAVATTLPVAPVPLKTSLDFPTKSTLSANDWIIITASITFLGVTVCGYSESRIWRRSRNRGNVEIVRGYFAYLWSIIHRNPQQKYDALQEEKIALAKEKAQVNTMSDNPLLKKQKTDSLKEIVRREIEVDRELKSLVDSNPTIIKDEELEKLASS